MARKPSPYNLSVKSDLTFLDMENQPQGYYKKVLLRDSILGFFPTAEIYIEDGVGVFPSIGFPEGLDLDVKLGDLENDSFIGHGFTLTEYQLNDTEIRDHFKGISFLMLTSKYLRKNKPKRKIYKGKISDIIKEIVLDEYEIDEDKIFIDATSGTSTYTRDNQSASSFIQELSGYAYSDSFPKSPYVSYIDVNGNFYFKALESLYLQNTIKDLNLEFSETMSVDPEVIQAYSIAFGGYILKRDDYLKQVSKVSESGEYVKEIVKLEDYKIGKNDNTLKYMVAKNFIGSKSFSFMDFGLYDKDEDIYDYKGLVNNTFLNSMIAFRLDIVTHFDVDALIGKTINVFVKNSVDDSYDSMYSGKWLIIDATNYYDDDGIPYKNLMIARDRMKIKDDHKFYDNFI